MAAVGRYGWVIEFASDRLRDDKDVVLTAVRQSKLLIKFASKRLKDDKEIALANVGGGWTIEFE